MVMLLICVVISGMVLPGQQAGLPDREVGVGNPSLSASSLLWGEMYQLSTELNNRGMRMLNEARFEEGEDLFMQAIESGKELV
jgi:hypothetical protein